MTNMLSRASLLAAVLVASAFLAPATKAASPPGPKKCYQSYLRSLYYAKDLNDVSGFWANKRSSLWTGLKTDAKKKKLDYLRSSSYVGGKYDVVSEKITGDSAHLVLKGINVNSNKTRIQACVDTDLVKEGGFWKITDATTRYVGGPMVASK